MAIILPMEFEEKLAAMEHRCEALTLLSELCLRNAQKQRNEIRHLREQFWAVQTAPPHEISAAMLTS